MLQSIKSSLIQKLATVENYDSSLKMYVTETWSFVFFLI